MSTREVKKFDYAPTQVHQAGFEYHVAREVQVREILDTQASRQPNVVQQDIVKPRTLEEIPNLDGLFQSVVGVAHGTRWTPSRLAEQMGATETHVSEQCKKLGIDTRRTGFELTGVPVAQLLFIDALGSQLPPPVYKAARNYVKTRYSDVIERLQAEKRNKDIKSGRR